LFLAPTILTEFCLVAGDAGGNFRADLPVLDFDKLDDALTLLRGKPTPLALYVFTRNRATEARVLADARSGGACVNDVVSHMIAQACRSADWAKAGWCAYHGRAGFDEFTHQRRSCGGRCG